MGKTKRKPETIYIDHEKFELLDQLAKTTRIPRSVLWREAPNSLKAAPDGVGSTAGGLTTATLNLSRGGHASIRSRFRASVEPGSTLSK